MLAWVVLGGLFPLAASYSLGRFCLSRVPVPRPIVLAIGAAIESVAVFILLLFDLANTRSVALLGAVSLLPLLWVRSKPYRNPPTEPLNRITRYLLAIVFAAYGTLYLIHTLAPEIQPDAISYHLGLVYEYARLGGFPDRVGFFEMLPQGMEMLFLFAFFFGRHSAAKLVHFGFLVFTAPLFLAIGRRLLLRDSVSLSAAALYFCAPVVGITGSCAYNDAALVFFILATVYLMLVWHQEQNDFFLLAAGITAGFCYAIKFTGILVWPLALVFVLLLHRRAKPALLLTAAAAAMITPWMIRNAILSGNPVAPLFNRWFPNPYFHPLMEEVLAKTWRTYGGFSPWRMPLDLTIGARLQGMLGPIFLLAPAALLALRQKAGRFCWLLAALLAIPWFTNIGTRFLMPALPFVALALMMALPRKLAWACVAAQAVLCWPNVIALYEQPGAWRLHGFPLRAALRIESESDYLRRVLPEYRIAEIVEADSKPGDRIFSLVGAPAAYITRELIESWQSARGDRLTDTLEVAALYQHDPFYNLSARWPKQPLRTLRFRLKIDYPGEWCVHEVRLFSGEERIFPRPNWEVAAWPNPWETPRAFDNNLATRWRTWENMRAGMYIEVDLDRPELLTGAVLLSHTPVYGVPVEFYGLRADGRWRLLTDKPVAELRPKEDIRRAAMRAFRREGIEYILAPAGQEGFGPVGKTLLEHEKEWGIERAGSAGSIYFFRILNPGAWVPP